ncbi:MAG: class I SAM-dependent methyltransferase [Pseudomonadota bacterium]
MIACRYCGSPLTVNFADLGATPLANSYLEPTPEAIAAERSFPLHVMVCSACRLVQTTETVPADAIFDHDYAYLSSYSASWVAHAKRYAEVMTKRFGLGPDSLAAEVASNDGYLLQHFAQAGIPVLGIEPAGNAASLAEGKGVPTRVAFFNAATARALAQDRRADLIAANNVLAHVPDIRDFAAGFPIFLAPEGVLTFEFPHLLNLINQAQFDTIYHEHYSYLSLLFVERLMQDAGMRVFDVEELPTHGGSLRVYACHAGAAHAEEAGLAKVRADEAAAGLDTDDAYAAFGPRIDAICQGFRAFLDQAEAEGKTVAAYGAAAKGNTFLNVAGVGVDRIPFVVDRNPEKQGRLLPGSHIPVHGPEHLDVAKPDYVVILPWNLAAEISTEHARIAGWGGRFVTAVPELRIL